MIEKQWLQPTKQDLECIKTGHNLRVLGVFSIEKANISIKKLNISIEKVKISIKKVIFSIKKLNIFIKKVIFFIKKMTFFSVFVVLFSEPAGERTARRLRAGSSEVETDCFGFMPDRA